MQVLSQEVTVKRDFTVPEGKRLTIFYDGSFSFGSILSPFTITVRNGGTLVLFSHMLTSETLQFFLSVVLEDRSTLAFESLFMRKGSSPFVGHVNVIHRGRESSSNVHIRGILGEKATVAYRGDVLLEKGSYGSQTFIEERALLFHRDADVTMDPTLRIYEQDVSAKHAATVGRLSEEELFYLASRGMEREEARALVGKGFLEPVIRRMDKGLRQTLSDTISQKFSSYAVS